MDDKKVRGEWVKDENIGTIYVKKILIEECYPILFSCVNLDLNKFYLAFCLEDDEDYLLANCEEKDIKGLIDNKMDIRSIFDNSDEFISIKWNNGIVCKFVNKDEIDFNELPPSGVFLN